MTTQGTQKKPVQNFISGVILTATIIICVAGAFVAGAVYTASTESTQIGEDKCRQITASQERYIGWKLVLDPGWKAYICKE